MHSHKPHKITFNREQRGYSLVEVIIVLVVLGVLASIALPKFVDLKRDATIATLDAIKGSLHSTTGIYQPLAAIRGVETGNVLDAS